MNNPRRLGPLSVLGLVSAALPWICAVERAPGASGEDPSCPQLPTSHRVSYKNDEPRLFRRIVELVEKSPTGAPSALSVVRTFQTCLGEFHVQAGQREEKGSDNGPSESISRMLGSIRFAVSADGDTFEVAHEGVPARTYKMRDEISSLARRATRNIVKRVERADKSEIANQLWFLWIESYLRAMGEKYNYYDYACDLMKEKATDRGRSFSVGFDVEIRADRVTVSEVHDEQLRLAGLAPEDEIVSLDGRKVAELTPPELQRYWLNPNTFSFMVVVRRRGELLRIVGESAPTRHRTLAWSARSEMGYVRIREFTRGSPIELRRALRRLEAQAVRRLVLDVRGNPGGLLSVGLVDMFLKPGQTVVSYMDFEAKEATDVDATVEYHGMPTALLVDRSTASMAEALAAAFRTHERGPVVGERTYGKGVGQSLYAVGDEGRLHLVERTYFYPGTRESWDGTGIAPTVEIEVGEETRSRLQSFLDSRLLRLDEQWEVDPILRAAERRLGERP